ncbi:MAG: RNA polymerase sigma-70 factor [Bacteroidales bacterium]|jgi:RNA polymerase sigma-70 factor (ECF subfamily)|nr:RNA polymerase sigma-70 factor [Bacteroidales bacterium]
MLYLEDNRLDAFRRMYEEYVSGLIRFAKRYIPADAAEDLVQNIFMELWESGKMPDSNSAASYLFVSVRNRCINHLKQEEVRNAFVDRAAFEILQRGLYYLDSVEKVIMEEEQWQQICHQIEHLPEKCRRIFMLSYFEDKKSHEIAEMLHLSIRTVEHHLYLGLKTLREKLTSGNRQAH